MPGAATTFALAINGNGQIAGGYLDSSNVAHGFLDIVGHFHHHRLSGRNGDPLLDVNLLGHLAGVWYDAAFNPHGFTYDGSTFTSLDFPGGSQTVANGINSAGEVVGSYVDAVNVRHGFTYAEAFITRSTLPDPRTPPQHLESTTMELSQVLTMIASCLTHGFLYSNGISPPWTWHGASGGTILNHINNKNQFAGTFYDASGEDHAITGH